MNLTDLFRQIKKKSTNGSSLAALKIGQTIKINNPAELAPFNLKLTSSGQAMSDLPELEGMVFKYDGKT
jgi:hypothetical protein